MIDVMVNSSHIEVLTRNGLRHGVIIDDVDELIRNERLTAVQVCGGGVVGKITYAMMTMIKI